MAVCVDCRTNKTFERGAPRCSACQAVKDAADERARAGLLPSGQSGPPPVSARLCVTTTSIPGYALRESLGVVSAECAFGVNLFRDFFAGMTDVFGGRSGATQNVLRDARDTCLAELRAAAAEQGGNGSIGIHLDYSEFSGGGKSMLFLVATGTAVVAEPVGVGDTEGRPEAEAEFA
jgi:LSD1 subclass zinc finger protein